MVECLVHILVVRSRCSRSAEPLAVIDILFLPSFDTPETVNKQTNAAREAHANHQHGVGFCRVAKMLSAIEAQADYLGQEWDGSKHGQNCVDFCKSPN